MTSSIPNRAWGVGGKGHLSIFCCDDPPGYPGKLSSRIKRGHPNFLDGSPVFCMQMSPRHSANSSWILERSCNYQKEFLSLTTMVPRV